MVAAAVVAGLLAAIPAASGGHATTSSLGQASGTDAHGGITLAGASMLTPPPVRYLGWWECDTTRSRVRCRAFGVRGRFVTSALLVVQANGSGHASVRARLPG